MSASIIDGKPPLRKQITTWMCIYGRFNSQYGNVTPEEWLGREQRRYESIGKATAIYRMKLAPGDRYKTNSGTRARAASATVMLCLATI